jgi:hypothetical protein
MTQWTRPASSEDRHRLAAWQRPVTVRLAVPDDLQALERLTQRDTRGLPRGPHLVAERDGRIEAAVSLASGELIADPFQRTAELRELLRVHAGDLRVARQRVPAAPLEPRPRLVTA